MLGSSSFDYVLGQRFYSREQVEEFVKEMGGNFRPYNDLVAYLFRFAHYPVMAVDAKTLEGKANLNVNVKISEHHFVLMHDPRAGIYHLELAEQYNQSSNACSN